jgi:copper(I)-binding protein
MLYRKIKLLILTAGFLALSPALVSAHSDGGIVIEHAWVREAPPVAKMLAAYMTIENHTGKDHVLTGVTSSSFKKIEMHKSMQKDGMATMQKQKQLTIPAGDEIKLQPGGYHLMLFNPSKPLKAGDEVNFTLKFANGSVTTITAKVKKATGGHDMKNMNMNNMHHDH